MTPSMACSFCFFSSITYDHLSKVTLLTVEQALLYKSLIKKMSHRCPQANFMEATTQMGVHPQMALVSVKLTKHN